MEREGRLTERTVAQVAETMSKVQAQMKVATGSMSQNAIINQALLLDMAKATLHVLNMTVGPLESHLPLVLTAGVGEV